MEALITFLRGGTGGGAAPLLIIIFCDHSLPFGMFSMQCSLSHRNMAADDFSDAGTLMTKNWE
jgi:hypothetical protein